MLELVLNKMELGIFLYIVCVSENLYIIRDSNFIRFLKV